MNKLINVSQVTHLLDAVASGAVTGATFATPAKAVLISYQSRFTSNPSAVNITLRGSSDGSTWQTLATLTTTTGQVGNITTSLPFIDAKINSITGGTGISVDVIAKPFSLQGNDPNSLTLTDLAVTGTATIAALVVSALSTLLNLVVGGTLNVTGLSTLAATTITGVTSVSGAATFSNASVKMTALPTSDPLVSGALWNDAGTIKISA